VEEFSTFVVAHGYWLIAGWAFMDQLGIPFPAIPVLVAGGALAGTGQLDFATALAAATLGCIPSDLIWYEAGRRRGGSVLRTLCRLSLEPDSCVSSTERTFLRHGPRSLLFAKFIPGYQTLAPPLAGMTGVPLGRFLLFDIPGAFLWSAAFLGLGLIFHDQIDAVFRLASELGTTFLELLVAGLVAYVIRKFYHRQRFLSELRTRQIEPAELKLLLEGEDEVAIIDLRSELAIELQPERIPGAQVFSLEQLESRHHEIPREREIILYCT